MPPNLTLTTPNDVIRQENNESLTVLIIINFKQVFNNAELVFKLHVQSKVCTKIFGLSLEQGFPPVGVIFHLIRFIHSVKPFIISCYYPDVSLWSSKS